ncbi:hypothetical protein CCACVL1_14073 [Corchorus capsularis]|uniref:F-box protein GID2 n=1 Tax=Corchorus capsularis TaxID=210143 RepID=A0A1R3I8C9_COCAP|nr:hypothetical protein CCACVL1_14073 [Corchorus capsularis]
MVKNAQRLISLALNSIFIIAIVVILFHLTEVGASRPLKHPLSPSSIKTLKVFKHVDARTLAISSCVSKLWQKTAKDERLWELICTRHWANIGCGTQQLRSVVLPLGGFRQLHSLYLWPLSKPQAASASSWAPFSRMINSKSPARWGKDEAITQAIGGR